MCRMYNDIGSITRDLDERNVNSTNFPEFDSTDLPAKKHALTAMAGYEESCYTYSLDLLDKEVRRAYPDEQKTGFGRRKMRAVQLFGSVTVLYDQLYVLRDLSSTIKLQQA